jgi:hypothetical protein
MIVVLTETTGISYENISIATKTSTPLRLIESTPTCLHGNQRQSGRRHRASERRMGETA